MSKGWSCPRCGKVFAPFIQECKSCNEQVARDNRPVLTPNLHKCFICGGDHGGLQCPQGVAYSGKEKVEQVWK